MGLLFGVFSLSFCIYQNKIDFLMDEIWLPVRYWNWNGTNIMDFENLWISSFLDFLMERRAIFEFVPGGTFYESDSVTYQEQRRYRKGENWSRKE